MNFGSLGSLAQHLASHVVADLHSAQKGLAKAAELIEQTAKQEIGHYQDAAGPFPEWESLAPETEEEKARLGYPLDAPLLRTGAMRDSIKHEVRPLEAIIGATDPKMAFHEFGTSRGVPPRPVLGPALYRNLEKVKHLVGYAAVAGMVGEDPIHPSLGYEHTIE